MSGLSCLSGYGEGFPVPGPGGEPLWVTTTQGQSLRDQVAAMVMVKLVTDQVNRVLESHRPLVKDGMDRVIESSAKLGVQAADALMEALGKPLDLYVAEKKGEVDGPPTTA